MTALTWLRRANALGAVLNALCALLNGWRVVAAFVAGEPMLVASSGLALNTAVLMLTLLSDARERRSEESHAQAMKNQASMEEFMRAQAELAARVVGRQNPPVATSERRH